MGLTCLIKLTELRLTYIVLYLCPDMPTHILRMTIFYTIREHDTKLMGYDREISSI
jgi:hypothetical protein